MRNKNIDYLQQLRKDRIKKSVQSSIKKYNYLQKREETNNSTQSVESNDFNFQQYDLNDINICQSLHFKSIKYFAKNSICQKRKRKLILGLTTQIATMMEKLCTNAGMSQNTFQNSQILPRNFLNKRNRTHQTTLLTSTEDFSLGASKTEKKQGI